MSICKAKIEYYRQEMDAIADDVSCSEVRAYVSGNWAGASLLYVEAEEAKKRGLEEFKYASNEEMLQAMGLTETA